jgi:hypothetical protein
MSGCVHPCLGVFDLLVPTTFFILMSQTAGNAIPATTGKVGGLSEEPGESGVFLR